MQQDLRPGLCEQRRRDVVPSGKCSRHHGTIQAGDEENLRIKEGVHGVEEGVVAFSPLGCALEECQVTLPCARGVSNHALTTGNTICFQYASAGGHEGGIGPGRTHLGAAALPFGFRKKDEYST